MEREDPLERLAREEKERKSLGGAKNKTLVTVMIVLAVIAAVLAVFVVITQIENHKYNELVTQLNIEKQDLTEQMEALQSDFAGLSSDYDSINVQLDASRGQIDSLVAELKNTEATNRRKMRQYEKELGTLRGIMRGYITQIDSLNTLNHKLTREAQEARAEAASQQRRNQKLSDKVENLSTQVAAGSVLKARGLRMEAYDANNKIKDKASKIKRMIVSLSLVANELAPRGPINVYVRVVAPDGTLLSDGRGASFTCDGQILNATASREVDYEGEEVDMSIYINNIASFQEGTYTMEAFTEAGKLGSAALVLK